ncbi:MAG TPA: citrate:proton symporter, partial [Blastocatellia bacterium]|nr:citrate:proton symporter [Blastocatellia bacterium]
MLALLGLASIVVLLAAIISKRISPLVALITVPTIAALIGGFGLSTGVFIAHGIQNIAPIIGMTVFAILYFGIISDAGMLDPIIDRILRAAGSRPTRIVVGTAVLAAIAMLEGSGAIAFLITIPVMLPLYERLQMDRRVLACAVAMAAGLINMLPWGGPTIRAAAALHVPVTELFNPVLPVLFTGLVFVLAVAWWLGKKEEKRLGLSGSEERDRVFRRELTEADRVLRRPGRFWPNVVLTVILVGVMVSGKVEPVVVFMFGTVLALLMNYPDLKAQRDRIDAHAKPALMMTALLLAAG